MSGKIVTTAEQLLWIQEPGFRHELVRGEVRRMSAAGYWHGIVIGRLATLLGRHVDERAFGYCFGAETGFVLARDPDTVRAPDVAFVATDRMPSEWSRGYFPGPPDLAVEVKSPDDSDAEVAEKTASWLAHGTREVWVVDPKARTVAVHRGPGDVRTLTSADEFAGSAVLPVFRVPVGDLFPNPPSR